MMKKRKKIRFDITAYRKKMGDFDKGATLKKHRETDKHRKKDYDDGSYKQKCSK